MTIIIYILGFVLSYIMLKATLKSQLKDNSWTLQDRCLVLLVSLLSWILVIVTLIGAYLQSVDTKISWDKEVKW